MAPAPAPAAIPTTLMDDAGALTVVGLELLGDFEGLATDGAFEGPATDGEFEGVVDGDTEGSDEEGVLDGDLEGILEGIEVVGFPEGEREGSCVVGAFEGVLDGFELLGMLLGVLEGDREGTREGRDVAGDKDGELVDKTKIQAAPLFDWSATPPMMAVFASPESPTEIPCKESEDAPLPTSFDPCCDHVPLVVFRTNSQVAPF